MVARSTEVALGSPAPAFSLPDLDGRLRGLADLRGPKGLVVAFICNHCPYVKAMIARLVADASALQAIGVGVCAVMPNDWRAYPEDAPERMRAFAKQHGFPFPYLLDETQAVARAHGAQCTPDLFGFDSALALAYRGRLDAGGVPDGAKPATAFPRELVDAMRAVTGGGAAPQPQHAAIGCSIKWRR